MLLGQGFAFYSFKERRYMFKRLTAFLHILSAICTLISIEVMVSSVSYERAHLPARHPAEAISQFGFSFVLACTACAAFFAAGLIFLAFSGKRKSKDFTLPETQELKVNGVDLEADSDEQDDSDTPVALGR